MIKITGIEHILKRLIEAPLFNGNMVQDTQAMYEESDESCTFKWIDERAKPTWAEITAEFYIYCAEYDSPLCPDFCVWNNGTREFEYDFSIVQDEKKIELSTACGDAIILTPVTSDTLGSIHTYDCREVDQTNANTALSIASVLLISKNLVCNDGSSYAPRPHTAEQIVAVLGAMNDHVETQKAHLVIRKGEVDAIDRANYETDAECVAVILAICW